MKGLGNFNFRGKKFFEPSCGCCSFENKKEDKLKELDMRDANEYYLDLYFDNQEEADMQEFDIRVVARQIRRNALKSHRDLLEIIYEILEDHDASAKFTNALTRVLSNDTAVSGFAAEDIANIFNAALDRYARRIAELQYDENDWDDYSDDLSRD